MNTSPKPIAVPSVMVLVRFFGNNSEDLVELCRKHLTPKGHRAFCIGLQIEGAREQTMDGAASILCRQGWRVEKASYIAQTGSANRRVLVLGWSGEKRLLVVRK